jgi:rare lipoprotein A
MASNCFVEAAAWNGTPAYSCRRKGNPDIESLSPEGPSASRRKENAMKPARIFTNAFTIAIPILLAVPCAANAATASSGDKPAVSGTKSPQKAGVDRSGKPRKGKASLYGKKFHGKKMADGTPMNPQSNVAASKTLPLGTKAKVTNLENGKSEVVEIRDRGPYVPGRIVDLSPKTADTLDIKKQGVAPVEVKPIDIPKRSESTKLGAPPSETKPTQQR